MVNKSEDHIRYSRQTGFSGITPKDKEQWMRKYPHIDDFDLTVEEGQAWLSENWNKSRMAEERPRDFLDFWLSCKWEKLNTGGYKEPETIYNPKQLSSFIEQYFINGALIKRLTLGKKSGLTDSLATEHYEKALGHAVKLREEVPDFPQTPVATAKPHLNLRRLQEWCIECKKVADDLLSELRVEHIDKPLCLLRELDSHLKSGYPPIDEKVYDRIKADVWNELEKLVKVIEELDEPKTTFRIISEAEFEYKTQYWFDRAILGRDCEQFIKKMEENTIQVPNDLNELADMISATEWMAKTDWDRVKTICKQRDIKNSADLSMDELAEQMSVLNVAKVAEEKINALVLKTYRQENRDYNKAFLEAENRKETLFNESADVLNSNVVLLKISYLRDNRLVSAFTKLYNALFNTSTQKFSADNPLQEIIDELEGIRKNITNYEATKKHVKTEQDKTTDKEHKEKAKTIDSVNIKKFQGILGDVQAKNLQIGDNARIDNQPKAKNKSNSLITKCLRFLLWLWTELKWILSIFGIK
ncbi:MAG: hypothetical protein KAV87_48865 [Desulfobacteraceae bacterium]|nr:hypothetical protein [Desulfobacteraceae bacterium]